MEYPAGKHVTRCRNMRPNQLFKVENKIYSNLIKQKLEGEKAMQETDILKALQTENKKLNEEKRTLLDAVEQMKVTLNRLIDHYIVEENYNT